MSALIYVETSIPSFYHETRPEMEHQARRKWTPEWWNFAMGRDTLVNSATVIAELWLAPEPKQSACIALLEPLQVLAIRAEIDELTGAYIAHKVMPRDAAGDARHLAVATFHRCDILATWNCRHIANLNKQTHIRSVNAALGFPTPALVTPLELLETCLSNLKTTRRRLRETMGSNGCAPSGARWLPTRTTIRLKWADGCVKSNVRCRNVWSRPRACSCLPGRTRPRRK